MNRDDSNSSATADKGFLDVYVSDHRFRAQWIETQSGLKDKPTLVFLHEGLGSIPQWGSFPPSLCRKTGCPGFLYERLGYGGSDHDPDQWPLDYLEKEIDLLHKVLNECNVKNPILIGHSDGGTIALLYGAGHSDDLRGIITEAAHIFVEDITIKGIAEVVKVYESDNLKEKLARYHGNKTDSVFRRWADRWLDPSFRSWNIEDSLPHITCPVLVIQGREDEYATLLQVKGIENKVKGHVTVRIMDNCKHVPHHQAREKVLKEMALFINGI